MLDRLRQRKKRRAEMGQKVGGKKAKAESKEEPEQQTGAVQPFRWASMGTRKQQPQPRSRQRGSARKCSPGCASERSDSLAHTGQKPAKSKAKEAGRQQGHQADADDHSHEADCQDCEAETETESQGQGHEADSESRERSEEGARENARQVAEAKGAKEDGDRRKQGQTDEEARPAGEQKRDNWEEVKGPGCVRLIAQQSPATMQRTPGAAKSCNQHEKQQSTAKM